MIPKDTKIKNLIAEDLDVLLRAVGRGSSSDEVLDVWPPTITDGLFAVAKAIDNLAEAVRCQKPTE